jgi:hypothetical protein
MRRLDDYLQMIGRDAFTIIIQFIGYGDEALLAVRAPFILEKTSLFVNGESRLRYYVWCEAMAIQLNQYPLTFKTKHGERVEFAKYRNE